MQSNSVSVASTIKCVVMQCGTIIVFLAPQVATLGKSGVSVGYYDTEENAARAYDRAAIGLLGRDNCSITTNFPLGDYDDEIVPQLIGKTREEVKTSLKNERAKVSESLLLQYYALRHVVSPSFVNSVHYMSHWQDQLCTKMYQMVLCFVLSSMAATSDSDAQMSLSSWFSQMSV